MPNPSGIAAGWVRSPRRLPVAPPTAKRPTFDRSLLSAPTLDEVLMRLRTPPALLERLAEGAALRGAAHIGSGSTVTFGVIADTSWFCAPLAEVLTLLHFAPDITTAVPNRVDYRYFVDRDLQVAVVVPPAGDDVPIRSGFCLIGMSDDAMAHFSADATTTPTDGSAHDAPRVKE